MKFSLSFIFMFSFCICSLHIVLFAEEEITTTYAAEQLVYYGFVQGTENGLELDRSPTRLEALIMLIRLMGNDANMGYWEQFYPDFSHPFSDIPTWAQQYAIAGYNYRAISRRNCVFIRA